MFTLFAIIGFVTVLFLSAIGLTVIVQGLDNL